MRQLIALIGIALLGLVVGGSEADAGKLGSIGDSMSKATNSDDDCDTIWSCGGKLGADSGYSWSTGHIMSNSIRNKLGHASMHDAHEDGKRWTHGPGQADEVVNNNANDVTVLLGANDVCTGLGQQFPTKAEIEGYIDSTFTKLKNGLPAGSDVIVSEIPDVVSLYNTMKYQDNFAFETCQAIWDDFDTSRLEVNTCDWGFFDFICDVFDAIVEFVADLDNAFGGPLKSALFAVAGVPETFPCGMVLNSGSNVQNRADADQLRKDINAALATKVAQHNGGGVTFRLANNIDEYDFTPGEVSQLDCFHPNRRGQQNLAELVYDDAYNQSQTPPVVDNAAPNVANGTVTLYRPSGATFVNFSSHDGNYENAYAESQLRNCWEVSPSSNQSYCSSSPCASWNSSHPDADFYCNRYTQGNPENHDLRYTAYGAQYCYYDVRVRSTDNSGNTGPWASTGCM